MSDSNIESLRSFQMAAYERIKLDDKDKNGEQIVHYFNDTHFFLEFFKAVIEPGSDVIDVGVNYGIHVDMLLQFPNCYIHGFEAAPSLKPWLEKKYINRENLQLHFLALSDIDGIVPFYEASEIGISALKVDKGSGNIDYNVVDVNSARLDSIESRLKLKKLSCIKMDIEGAEMSALQGSRKLLAKHRPYIIMEWAHSIFSFSCNGSKLNEKSILNFAIEENYLVYNIYGICLSDEKVYEASVLKDTFDLILVPKEKLEIWSTILLPRYQYAIFDKLLNRMENFAPKRQYYGLTSLPRRIYKFVNENGIEESIRYFEHMHNQMHKHLQSINDFQIETLRERGIIVLQLIYNGKFQEAYELAAIKSPTANEIENFKTLID